uniref:Uncharacterized protein n=1 Tax=Aureoumbra lagunensis TaxID=44058 RepID=A0A6S8EQN7_9STRA
MLETRGSQWNEAKQTRFSQIHCFECARNVGALYSQKYEGAEPGQPFRCCKLAIIVERRAGIKSSNYNNLVFQSTSRIEANDVVESLLKVKGGYCGDPVTNKRTLKSLN